MGSFHECMNEYRKQLEKGAIQQAYRGLMQYIMDLRTFFQNKYPDYVVSGSIYYGYMDMTYFAFSPPSLKDRKLKVAIVFVHEAFRFEVWLAAYNKVVQSEYWRLLKESGWGKYEVVSTTKGVDAIVEHTLVANPDFADLDALTRQIESGALEFIQEVESFLSSSSAGAAEGLQWTDKREYTTAELAALAKDNGLPMTARSVDRLCQQGRIPARRVGSGVRAVWLISADDAQRWLEDWLARFGATASAIGKRPR